MRFVIVLLFWLLTGATVFGQSVFAEEQPKNLGQAIGVGAERNYAQKVKELVDLEAKLEAAQAKIAELERVVANLKGETVSEVVPAKIVVEMLVNRDGESICPGCEAWWSGQDRRDLVGKGWIVERVGIQDPLVGKLYPRWRVCIKEECGYIEYTPKFQDALRSYLERRKR